jgi:hypothetical protein
MDGQLLLDSVTPSPKPPKQKSATRCLLTAAQNVTKWTILTVCTKRTSASSSSLPPVDNPLSTVACGQISFQQIDNSSGRALMPVTIHSSPQTSQQKRATADTDSEHWEAKKTNREQRSSDSDQFKNPQVRTIGEHT